MNKALEMKQKYKGKEYNGYKWFYCDSTGKYHFFEKLLPSGKYTELRCTTEQLENGSFEYMADHDLTYIKKCGY